MKTVKINKDRVEESMWGMANLPQGHTNLPMIIWVQDKEGVKHGPRIKVMKTHSHKMDVTNTVSISIEDEPKIRAGRGLNTKDFELVKQFIKKNKKLLLDYWEGNIFTPEMIAKLKPIEN